MEERQVFRMIVFMKVTRDKYELPIAIADSIPELAKITGTNENTIKSAISHCKNGRRKTSVYQAIEIGGGE